MSQNPWTRDGYYIVRPTDRNTIIECPFIERQEEPSLDELQRLVGGYIEFVQVPFPADAFVNEEGKLKGLPFNPLASALYASPSDNIVGTMVICCGKARETREGEE